MDEQGKKRSDKPSRTTFRQRLDNMVEALRTDLLAGKYEVGGYLPSEEALVTQFQLSNKSVRKGLDQLVEEGWIVKIPRVGSQVTEAVLTRRKVTITLGVHAIIYRDFGLEKLLADFHVLHPEIEVQVAPIPITKEGWIFKEYLEQGAIDVMTMNEAGLLSWEKEQALTMLEELPVEEATYRFLQDVFTSNGKKYVQPIIFSPVVLVYNRKHFAEAGLPEPDGSWDWDTMLACAARLTQHGRYGFYTQLISENRWPIFFLQHHFQFLKAGFDREKLLASARLCRMIMNQPDVFPSYLNDQEEDVHWLFVQEKVSMMMTSYSGLNDLRQAAFPVALSPVPRSDRSGDTLTIPIGVAINRLSKNKEAAYKLVQYLASERAQRMIRRETWSLPAHKAVAEEDVCYDDRLPQRYALFREMLGSFRFYRDLHIPVKKWPHVRNLMKLYWADLLSEEELCAQMEQLLTAAD